MLKLSVILIPCLLCLSACTLLSPKAEYIPDNEVLKSATVGVPYRLKIDILGGAAFRGGSRKPGFVSPTDTGISIHYCQLSESEIKDMEPRDANNYNCVELYGTPIKSGVLKITIKGGMYGSMIAPSSRFSKDYTLKINQP